MRTHQVLVELLGKEGRVGREQFRQGDQAFVERLVGRPLVRVVLRLPEAATAAAHVPVREGLDERLDPARGRHRVVIVQPGRHIGDELVELREEPPVELASRLLLVATCFPAVGWLPAVDVGIGDEEGVRVPEGEDEAAPHLVARRPAVVDVVGRVVPQEEPAHHVHAHALRRVVEPDGVAFALVHLLAVLVAHQAVAEYREEWLAVLQRGAQRQHRVEPVAELAGEALSDEGGGKPLLPVRVVVPIAKRGERDDAGVQPGVAHVGDARDGLAALRTAHLHGVDPRPVGRVVLELLPALCGLLAQLVAAADHLDVAAGAGVDRQGQAVVALLRDHPVGHVAQPVQLARQPELRDPADLPRHRHHRLAQLVHRDEPLVDEAEDQLAVAAPADGVAMAVLLGAIEQPFLPQRLEDRRRYLAGEASLQEAEALDVVAEVVERGDGRQVELFAQGEVVLAAARRDVDDAGALLLAHV